MEKPYHLYATFSSSERAVNAIHIESYETIDKAKYYMGRKAYDFINALNLGNRRILALTENGMSYKIYHRADSPPLAEFFITSE